MNHQDVADMLGLTLVQVNRVPKRLCCAGLAAVIRGMVQIHDMAGLRSLARPILDVFERSRPEFDDAVHDGFPMPLKAILPRKRRVARSWPGYI